MGFMEEETETKKQLSRKRVYLLQIREYDNNETVESKLKESQYYFDDFDAMISTLTKNFELDKEKEILENTLVFDVDKTDDYSKSVRINKSDKEYYFLLRSFGWKLYYE